MDITGESPEKKLGEEIKTEIKAKEQQEFKFINSIKKNPGHILFSFNITTKELKEAAMKKDVSIGLGLEPIYKTKVVTEKNCVYVQALNKRNAFKKLRKMGVSL